MANLVETVLGAFSPNAISQIAALLGESGSATGRGLAAAIPTLLAGAATLGKSAGGADLLGLVNSVSANGNPLDTLGSRLADETSRKAFMAQGAGVANSLLGSQAETVANAIAGLVGAKPTSVQSLLAFAAPLALGALGKGAGETPNAGGIAAMLANGNSSIYRGLPAGLRGFFSLEPPGAADEIYSVPDPFAATLFGERKAPSSAGGTVPDAAPYLFQPKSYALAWVLLGAGVLALLFSMVGKRERPVAQPVAVAAAAADVSQGSGLLSQLRDGKPLLIVLFSVGLSDVANELEGESARLKDYLDANPGARVSVSGFVDATGDPVANEELARSRAQKVAAVLAAAGIAEDRIDMDKPADIVADGASYANDRKVEVSIKDGVAAAVATAADAVSNAVSDVATDVATDVEEVVNEPKTDRAN
jgi:flagellar motor protein MotB